MNTIETPRLTLKPLRSAHCANLLPILSDRATAWWADLPRMRTPGEVRSFIHWGNFSGQIIQYGLFEKGSDTAIGFLQVKLPAFTGRADERELGYVLSKDYRGRGYMSEAVKAVCEDVFKDGSVRAVTLEVLPDNGPSQGVARKCGFVLEPQGDGERELRYLDGAPLDRLVLTAEEARRKKSRAA